MNVGPRFHNASGQAREDRQRSLDSFVALTHDDLRETIAFLIEDRELLRDENLARLEEESKSLATRIKDLDQRKLVVELECFKGVLALHKRLVENGRPRH